MKFLFLTIVFCLSFTCQNIAYEFPQGVASGDPQPGAITLWTRVINPDNVKKEPVNLRVQVSLDSTFEDLELEDDITARVDWDYTVRYYATGLKKNQRYYYRFIAGEDVSMTGRTITAPDPGNSEQLNIAVLACQSYEQGFFGTLKTLIEEDKKAPDSLKIDFILHVGDFIYEVVGDDPRNDNHNPKWLTDRFGNERDIPPFPVGAKRPDKNGDWKSGSTQPLTVEDYRHLYKVYISNPVLKEARARWPYACTWDDHEFTDNNYQSEASAREALDMDGIQAIKTASNQAWFEYIPAALSNASKIDGVNNIAYDFSNVDVINAPLGDNVIEGLIAEENNLMAINSINICRALDWGSDIRFFLTDTKSYQYPGFSVLGLSQKEWFLDLLEKTESKWKFWANSEPFGQVNLNFRDLAETGYDDDILYRDSWVKTPGETSEIMEFIKVEEIEGFVVFSGDYHIQMANVIHYEGKPFIPDFSATSIAAFADFFWLDRKGEGYGNKEIQKIFSYSDKPEKKLPNINLAAMHGTAAALEYAESGDLEKAMQYSDTTVNPGLKYFDCFNNGYILVNINSDRINTTFVNTENARVDYEGEGAPVVSRIRFTLPWWSSYEQPDLKGPHYEGKVFPGSWD